jgi:hypothetical protein
MNKGSWHEGTVNTEKKHLRIVYDENNIPVCLVQPEKNNNSFIVQFIIDRTVQNQSMIEHVIKELDFYLVEKDEYDHWEYALYHCTTASNLYSKVHWVMLP